MKTELLEKIELRQLQWQHERREWLREIEQRIERRHWQTMRWSIAIATIGVLASVLAAILSLLGS